MPINVGSLRRLLKSKLPYIDRNIDALVSVIRRSMQNAAAFEPIVQSLRESRRETVRDFIMLFCIDRLISLFIFFDRVILTLFFFVCVSSVYFNI